MEKSLEEGTYTHFLKQSYSTNVDKKKKNGRLKVMIK